MDVWMGKKVYVETYSGRQYCGIVSIENSRYILLRDVKGHLVELKRDEIKLIQEEE